MAPLLRPCRCRSPCSRCHLNTPQISQSCPSYAECRGLDNTHIFPIAYKPDEFAPYGIPLQKRGCNSRKGYSIGGPEQCLAQTRRFVETFGMTHLICRLFFPNMTHQHIMRELELLAQEVMPAFQ